MYERYTEKARRVVFFSRHEASAVSSPYINPEHILLGVLCEDKALMALLLDERTAATEMVEQVRAAIGVEPSAEPSSGDLPLSNNSKRVLAYAFEESDALGSRYIEPGHVLLGLLREPSLVSPVLAKFGLAADKVRQRFLQVSNPAPMPNPLPALRESFARAIQFLPPEVEPATTFRLRRGPQQ